MGLFGGAGGGAATAAAGQEFDLNGRRLRVVRQLGEGGYSFVFLVREVEAAGGGGLLPTTFCLQAPGHSSYLCPRETRNRHTVLPSCLQKLSCCSCGSRCTKLA
jgi:hypothetical protein